MNFTRHFAHILLAVSVAYLTSGCSVYMAANQPGRKDLKVLTTGTPRAEVIAELGTPATTELKSDMKLDQFNFTQGYSTPTRVARALGHSLGDVATLFLWEVVGTPIELIFDGQELSYKVSYDLDDKVSESANLKAERKKAKQ